MKSEKTVSQEIRIEATKRGDVILWTNPTGNAWTGEAVELRNKVQIAFPRRVSYGLAKGSPDLIGITEVLITPEMVGSTVGIFTATEVKKQGWKAPSRGSKQFKHHQNQMNFIDAVLKKGGIAGFVQSTEEFDKMIDLFIGGK